MKKTKLIISLLIVVCICVPVLNAAAYSDLPVQLDFSKGSVINGFSTHTYASSSSVYGRIQNGRYVMRSDGVGNTTSSFLQVYKEFDTAVAGGVIAIDYSFKFESGSLYAFKGLPILTDTDGKKSALLRMTSYNKTYSSYGINNSDYGFQDTKWTAGQEYDVRILCDLDNKTYRFYQAKSGEALVLKQLPDGSTDIPMNVKNIKKIMFSFETMKTTTSSVSSFGYFKMYRYGGDDVYVSPTYGNDLNNGSYEEPFATYERALESGSKHIYLLNGTYNFGSEYTYGTLNYNSSGATPIRPMVNSTIKVEGEYKIDFPELDAMNVKSEFKNDVLSRIKSDNYIKAYPDEKVMIGEIDITFDDATNTHASGIEITNPGTGTEKFMFFVAVYDSSGQLYRIVSENFEIKNGYSAKPSLNIELPSDFDTLGYYVRTFLWNGDTLSPYI